MACHMMWQANNWTHIDLLAIRLLLLNPKKQSLHQNTCTNIIFHENVFEKSQEFLSDNDLIFHYDLIQQWPKTATW